MLRSAVLLGFAAVAAQGCAGASAITSGSAPATASGDDDGASEIGSEGDDDALPLASVAPVSGAGDEVLFAEVARIVSRARESTYSHRTRVDETAGLYDLDCSGLVDYALARVAPDAYATLRRGSRKKRPLAEDFVALFVGVPEGGANGRWRRVDHAADLVPGDVVSWTRPADVVSKNIGHVMIVRGPVVLSEGEVAVPIFDSTSSRHGADDSRFATKATGVGEGTIHLLVDDAGRPTGYRWSNGRHARNHATIVGLGHLDGTLK